jgi:hypothetical protein
VTLYQPKTINAVSISDSAEKNVSKIGGKHEAKDSQQKTGYQQNNHFQLDHQGAGCHPWWE